MAKWFLRRKEEDETRASKMNLVGDHIILGGMT